MEGEGTENRAPGLSQTPAREKLLFAPFLSRSEAESASPGGGGRGRNKQSKREKTAEGQRRGEGNRVRRKGSEPRAQRGTEGLRDGSLESQRGDLWGPGRIRRCQEVLGRPARAHGVPTVPSGLCGRRSTAGLRRHRPAGGGRGKVRGSEAAMGNRTYVPSACWRRLHLAGVQGASGPRALASRRPRGAGQGRAGLRAAPSAAGVCPSLAARAGPSSQCRAEANGAPSPPTHQAASPPGWPPGRAGERGWGTGFRATQPRLS